VWSAKSQAQETALIEPAGDGNVADRLGKQEIVTGVINMAIGRGDGRRPMQRSKLQQRLGRCSFRCHGWSRFIRAAMSSMIILSDTGRQSSIV
jgi:hypothetical protein